MKFALLLLSVLLCLGLQGCGDAPRAPAEAEAASPPFAHRYEVLGVLTARTGAVGGLERVSIRHEEIPGFRDLETGEVVGMPAMEMPFPVAGGLPVPEVGQEVRFTMLVDGGDHGGLPYVIEALEVVPATP